MVFPKKNADWDYPERGRSAKRTSGSSRLGAERGPSERLSDRASGAEMARIDPLSGHARNEDPAALSERVVFRLWADGLVNARSVEQARREVDGRLRLDQALARLNLVDGDACAEALAAELGLPVASPEDFPREAVVPELLPGRFVAEALALPLADDGQAMRLAMADPIDDYSLRAIAMKTRRRLEICVASPGRLEAEIARLYKGVNRSEAETPARRRPPSEPVMDLDRPEDRSAGYRETETLDYEDDGYDDDARYDEPAPGKRARDRRDREEPMELTRPADPPRFVATVQKTAASGGNSDEPLELGPADRTPRQPSTPRFVRPRRVTLKDRVSDRGGAGGRRDASGAPVERRKISQRRLDALRAEVSARLTEPPGSEPTERLSPAPEREPERSPATPQGDRRFFAGFVNGFMGVQAGLEEGVDSTDDDWLTSSADDGAAPSWAERRAAIAEDRSDVEEPRRRRFGLGRWRSERKTAAGAGEMVAQEDEAEFDVARDDMTDADYAGEARRAGGLNGGAFHDDAYADDAYADDDEAYASERSAADDSYDYERDEEDENGGDGGVDREERPLDTDPDELFAAAQREMGRFDGGRVEAGADERPGDDDAAISRTALVSARDRSKTSAARRLVMDRVRRTLRGEDDESSAPRSLLVDQPLDAKPASEHDFGSREFAPKDSAPRDFTPKNFAPLTGGQFGDGDAIYQAARAVEARGGGSTGEVGSQVRHTLISEPPSVSRPAVATGPSRDETIRAETSRVETSRVETSRVETSRVEPVAAQSVSRFAPTGGADLEALKFSAAVRAKLDTALDGGEGLILICGPSGSSKAGTLQALAAIAAEKTGGKLLRFDKGEARPPIDPEAPPPIFTGEIRDAESAEAAARAAMTGALVLATLDAPSAASAPPRLIEMGLPPYVLASSLRAVVAQHLAPKLCARCGVRCVRDACPDCGGDQPGSVAIVESLILDDTMRALILAQAPAAAFRHAMTAAEAPSLADDAAEKVAAGLIDARDAERAASAASM